MPLRKIPWEFLMVSKNGKCWKKLLSRHLRHGLRSENRHLIWSSDQWSRHLIWVRSVVRSVCFGSDQWLDQVSTTDLTSDRVLQHPICLQISGQIRCRHPIWSQISGQIRCRPLICPQIRCHDHWSALRSGAEEPDLSPDQWSTPDLTTGLSQNLLIWPLICSRSGVVAPDLNLRGITMEISLDHPWYNMKTNKVGSLVTLMMYHRGSMMSPILGRDMRGTCPSLTILVWGSGPGTRWLSIFYVKLLRVEPNLTSKYNFYTGV